MRALRLLFRALGWLLTPFVAWAASFFGAVGGAEAAKRIDDPATGLVVTAVTGAITGFSVLILWLKFLRRSPEVQQVLAVREDGTPDMIAPLPDQASTGTKHEEETER